MTKKELKKHVKFCKERKFRWIARDCSGWTFAYSQKPYKGCGVWLNRRTSRNAHLDIGSRPKDWTKEIYKVSEIK